MSEKESIATLTARLCALEACCAALVYTHKDWALLRVHLDRFATKSRTGLDPSNASTPLLGPNFDRAMEKLKEAFSG